THGPIEAALSLRDSAAASGPLTVVVHPVARQAAALDDVADGLQAKFSIPYLVAFALLRGAPRHRDFEAVDPEARVLARESITVTTDAGLGEMEARLESAGETVARVETALGSPA